MSAEMSGEQMQAKIAAARRDAEGLKDKIKRKKDELADTSCKFVQDCGSGQRPLRSLVMIEMCFLNGLHGYTATN